MTIPILMYHQVDVPPPSGTPLRGLVVSPQAFARQMALLRYLGFQGLSMRELMPYLRGERSGRVVGITFDDGYRNNLDHALPALLGQGHSATCYVVSRAVGGRNTWDASIGVPDKALMSVEDLRRWQEAGMEVGAHTLDHADLLALPYDAAQSQIADCRHALEDLLGREVRHFCYPYGRYEPRHCALVREAGYLTATTTHRGRVRPGDDPMQLRRVLVAQATRPWHFLLKLLTTYEDRRG